MFAIIPTTHIHIYDKTPDRPTKIFEDLGNSKLLIYHKEKRKEIEFLQLLNIHDYGQGCVNENQHTLI